MKKIPPLLALLTLGSLFTGSALAANLFWDINGATAGAGGATPSGTWDTGTTANWTTDSTGSSAATTWASANTAIFSAGTDATGLFTVTLVGTETVAGLTLNLGTVTLGGSGAVAVGANNITVNSPAILSIASTSRITASAGATLTLNGGTIRETNPGNAGTFISSSLGIIVVASGGTVDYTSSGTGTVSIYSGSITGTGILTKTGANEFRFQGADASSTFSKLVVNQGLYRLGNGAGNDERGFGAAPGSFTADAITLTGGGAIGVSFGTTLTANRGSLWGLVAGNST